MTKTALITGISGQDAAYLAKFLLEKGYRVVGGLRRSSHDATWRLQHLGIADDVELVEIELSEFSNIYKTLEEIKPHEVYNLAAQSYVPTSFVQPIYTSSVNGLGVARLLDSIKTLDSSIRFYQASTSEMFGKVREVPQNELTAFHPRSPYGVSKLYAHWMTINYRESYGLHASSGILFNHESPLRGENFVTRKITKQLSEVKHGKRSVLKLGNLNAQRDWGFAGDYVEGMWMMLQQSAGDDFVLATGECWSVRQFVESSCRALELEIEWTGSGLDEKGIDKKSGSTIIEVEPNFYRPAEVDMLLGDPSKAEQTLGWKRRTSFEKLVELMVEYDERTIVDH